MESLPATIGRQAAVESGAALVEACAELRVAVDAYEALVREVSTRASTAEPSRLVDIADFVPTRQRLTEAIEQLELERRAWRVSIFRLQVENGMFPREIARRWGVSRQLVCRLIATQPG